MKCWQKVGALPAGTAYECMQKTVMSGDTVRVAGAASQLQLHVDAVVKL